MHLRSPRTTILLRTRIAFVLRVSEQAPVAPFPCKQRRGPLCVALCRGITPLSTLGREMRSVLATNQHPHVSWATQLIYSEGTRNKTDREAPLWVTVAQRGSVYEAVVALPLVQASVALRASGKVLGSPAAHG